VTIKINLGCGDNKLPGWLNHDADIDITYPLPWPDDYVDFILIEHCVEHISYHEAVRFFKEAYRVLRIGGVLRVIVPSITQILLCDDQEYFDWLKKKGWAPTADTRGALDAIIWQHGHQHAWTATLMEATLYYAGFNAPRKCDPYVSSHPSLCNVDGHHKVIGDKFNRIESLVFEGAKSTADLDKDYDANFFAMHVGWKDEYRNMARILTEELPDFQSATDFGCGNGYLVGALRDAGKYAVGIDGSHSVLKYDPSITIADIVNPLVGMPCSDLVICTEVAEHIEEKYADALLDNLCRPEPKTIFFSAAESGYGGHLHVNEQPRKYWIDKFGKRGYVVDHIRTQRIAERLRLTNRQTWWFAKNCFVLTKRQLDVGILSLSTAIDEELFKTLTTPRRKIAVVIGGSESVWDDFWSANDFCAQNGLEPEYFATNDMIAQFHKPITAVTLHPDKLSVWLPARQNNGFPFPEQVWCHDGGDRKQRPNPRVTHRLRDWGGSVGLFGYAVARQKGHDRVILCGVPMTQEAGHFIRKTRWLAQAAFIRAWENRKEEMAPYVRSLSGGRTEEMFGKPTAEWLRQEELVSC
jgi:SAM-dependent methyltransferase